MIITFQMWKIVLGLVISGFLIVFAVNYIGGYTAQQNDVLRAKILNTFELACYNVYNTGNSMVFDDFTKVPSDISFSTTEQKIKIAGLGSRDIKVPVFFSVGDKMVIWRGEQDLGWWKFRYVVAIPETEIVFSVGSSPNALETMEGIVKALPDTTNFKNKVAYAFCNGNKIDNGCGTAKQCEAKALLDVLSSGNAPRSSKCTADIGKNQRLVTISMSCTNGMPGVCIEPQGPASGKARLEGSETVFVYGDYADLAALIAGYNKKDAYGVLGEAMYAHKNAEMAMELGVAAKIMAKRAELLASGLTGIAGSGKMDADADEMACVKLFQELSAFLDGVASSLGKGVDAAAGYMERAGEKKREIVEKGCDYD